MNSILTARLSWIVPLMALIVAAGCAAPRGDLSSLKNPAAPVEAPALPEGIVRKSKTSGSASEIMLTGGQKDEQPRNGSGQAGETGELNLEKRVQIPKDLPGAEVPPLNLPPKEENKEKWEAAIRKLFPSLIDPPPMNLEEPEAPRRKMTLFELEQMALANSPLVAQAQADITTQAGQAIQAGTPPNPIIGYEADTVGSAGTRNYQGVYATQIIKTAGKLQLAQSIENVDLMNAQLALRQTRIELVTQVRRQYFAILVAREAIKFNEAIVRFTHELFRIQVDQASQDIAALYEPAWLRTFAVGARGSLVAARNNYIVAWKQLTATLNDPQLPLADLADDPLLPVPQLDYDKAIAHVLSENTEARAARNMPIRAQLDLRLQELIPIPDINAYITFQRDFTTPGLGRTTYNTQVGMPFPIFDRNKGNILSARGSLVRATREVPRVENDLRSRLAEAFGRFETSRYLVGTQRKQILPDAVRAYRGTYQRYIQASDETGGVGFADVTVAQQNLLNAVAAFLGSLSAQWNALVDIANLLQVDSLEELHLGLRDGAAPAEPIPVEGKAGDREDDVTAMLNELLLGEEAE